MTRANAWQPLEPSRSHGEEIAAALFAVAMERAQAAPVAPLRAMALDTVAAKPQTCER